jgi:hypothetical protein
MPKDKLTIAELEAILNSEDSYKITINPDGSITAVPQAPVNTAAILKFVRREPIMY